MQSKSKEPTAMFLIKKSSNIFLLSELACAKCGFNPFLELLRFLKEDMCVWSVWNRLIKISLPSEELDIKPHMGVQLEYEESEIIENNTPKI